MSDKKSLRRKWLKPLPNTIKSRTKGCLNCGITPIKLKMNYRCFQGFGGSHIKRDGKIYYMPDTWRDGDCVEHMKKSKTLMTFEILARKIGGDWRVVNEQPLHSEVYQRQGKNNWIMVKKGLGFA